MKTDRLSATFNNVGTTFEETTLDSVHAAFYIIRARAEITSGSGTQVSLSIRETSSPSDTIDVALEYALTTSPLDSNESVFFKAQDTEAFNEDLGKVYIAVKCDSGTNNTVRVSIDYTKIY